MREGREGGTGRKGGREERETEKGGGQRKRKINGLTFTIMQAYYPPSLPTRIMDTL